MAFSLPLCLEGQHPGVASSLWMLRLVFCEASISQTRDSNVLVLLLSCAPGPPTSLSILVRARLCCSLKGVVHTIVGNLQFLGNFSPGIAFISQNKNRLWSLRRKLYFSGHFESIIETTNADAPYTQLAHRKASFIAPLIGTIVFSCANIIAQGFSNHQFACLTRLFNTMYH